MILRTMPRPLGLSLLFIASFVVFMLGWWLAVLPLVVVEEGLAVLDPGDAARYLHWLTTPSEWDGDFWWLVAFGIVGSAAQVAFVAPLVGPPRLTSEGRSLRASVAGAAAIGGLLAVAALLTIQQSILLVRGGEQSIDGLGRMTEILVIPLLLLAWIASGAIWMIVLRKAARSRDPNGLAGLLRILLAGTCIELVLSIPLYALARRRESCYCSLPTFWSIISGTAALVWMCGPWAVLWLTREYRRGWRRAQCGRCGYPRQSGSPCCSECGLDFRDAAEEPTAESRG